MPLTGARLTLRGLRRQDVRPLARRLVAQIREDDVWSLAAGVAFRIFLSLFPALFAAVAVFGIVLTGQEVVALLEALEFVPGTVRAELEDPLVRFTERNGGGATLTVAAGVLGGLWAASSAAVLLARALTRIYGYAETRRFLRLRMTGVLIASALFGALIALMLLLVAGRALQAWVLDALVLARDAEAGLGLALTLGRWFLAVLVLVALFAFVYWVGPDRRAQPRFQWLSPGAVLGVVGWIALSALFNLYTRLAGENEVYGALGGVIVVLLWLQLTMAVLLVGAELNALLRRLLTLQPELAGEDADVTSTQ